METLFDQKTINILPSKDQEEVTVATSISNGDFGGCYIQDANGTIIHRGLSSFILGRGANLRGQKRTVVNNVFDIRPFGNTRAVHKFSGEAVGTIPPFAYAQNSADGIVVIKIEYTFQ